ncbi:claudin-7 [Eucyclogobius newberryi]|uniref:claudin-7 n=1 Tax=Eucyclogobius newberryi TaxID=166745 RepID=UPI003B59AFBF
MASSGVQLFGFVLALLGLAGTIAATYMVEWKQQSRGKTHNIYDGLWMSCSEYETTDCDFYESIFKLPVEIQATRVAMLLSIFLSAVGLLVSTLGMKCTRFMDGKSETKAHTAMTGGIIFIIAGLLSLIITSWYVSYIVDANKVAHHLNSFEFGKAIFISWAGSLLNILGGVFLCYRRCSRSTTPHTVNHLLPTSNQKSDYV